MAAAGPLLTSASARVHSPGRDFPLLSPLDACLRLWEGYFVARHPEDWGEHEFGVRVAVPPPSPVRAPPPFQTAHALLTFSFWL